MESNLPSQVFLIPIVGIVSGVAMIIAIVLAALWYKARERELSFHQEMRLREMQHQQRMKELEIDLEKAKARQP